ncbi:MAG: SLBB domain-containing protein [bacterium]|nr:SLBB domain-containing protein [bacterium]
MLRGNQVLAEIDFYRYLLEGRRGDDPVLRDGDTVLIPARTITVRVEGEVRRPQAYELLDGEDVLDLIRYAGGFTAEAVADVVHVARVVPFPERRPEQPDRVQSDLDLRLKMRHLLRDADAVRVDRIPERLENWVEAQGNVKNPGRYQYREGMAVADLVRQAGGLWADTLPERALIERLDPDLTYRTIEVSLADVLSGAAAPVPLQSRDKLRVFSRWDLRDRYRVSMSGEVRAPGEFDFREGMTLGDLVLLAGGLRESADVLHAEVSRLRRAAVESRDTAAPPASTVEVIDVALGEDWLRSGGVFALEPHDRVAVRKLPWWELPRTVTLQGEVYYPGAYALESPDERVSSVIARAGGLKPTAYAPGARIVRGKDDIGNLALDLDRALRKPGSEQDAILEQGDDIRIPARPSTVKVTGAVGFPTSIVYEKGRSLGDYVARAGGYAHEADKWKTHVVYPNGMSKQIRRIWGDPDVMPGSTIVVPARRPETGPGKIETLKEIASILASAATVYLVIDRTTN